MKGKNKWQIWYLCSVCGEPVFVEPNSKEHRMIVDFFRYRGWGHPGCANRRFS